MNKIVAEAMNDIAPPTQVTRDKVCCCWMLKSIGGFCVESDFYTENLVEMFNRLCDESGHVATALHHVEQ